MQIKKERFNCLVKIKVTPRHAQYWGENWQRNITTLTCVKNK